MQNIMIFLHVLGSIGMGFYLFLPFLTRRLDSVSKPSQLGYVQGLHSAGKIGQYLLILQFITGGYLIGKGDYSLAWLIVSIVVFLIISALTGILGANLKRMIKDLQAGKEASSADRSKIKMFGMLTGIFFLVIIFLMKNPMIFS